MTVWQDLGPFDLLKWEDQGTGTFAVATPLPATLPLFATGLGTLGLFGWRRKRNNTAAIAANFASTGREWGEVR
jgi:hypothetical protein